MAGLKKLCILMPVHFLASRGGGAEIQVKYLSEILLKTKRYEIHFLCRRVPSQSVTDYRIWKIGSEDGLGKLGTFVSAVKVYQTLKKISPQIIYQNVGCAYTGVAAWYTKRSEAKLLWHIASDMDVDDTLIVGFKNRLKSWVDRQFLAYGIRNANIIAAQTEYQNQLLQQGFARRCDAFVPIGHPLPEEVDKSNEKITVLCIASLKPLKQPDLFIKMAKLLNKIPNAEFVMMGYASQGRWSAEILKEIDAVPNLKYIGLVSQNEVNQRLSKGHILVNTSRYEGFSNTFIQAWMRGVPVVSLNVDPDGILSRKKIGFHSRTFIQLCNEVKTLIIDSSLRNEMGQRANRYASENHTVEIMADSLISLFNSM